MRSKFEKLIHTLLKRAKIKFEYESVKLPYTLEGTYVPDFIVGSIHIEAKGYLRPEDRKKLLAVKRQHPDLDLRLWFMQDNYLNNKTKSTRYSTWAKRNGFKYHIGDTLPADWFGKRKSK